MMTSKLSIAVFGAALLSAPAFAQTNNWTIDPNHSQAGFTIRHLGVSNVHGTISKVSGTVVWDMADPSKDSVVADIDATTIDTTVTARDTHLKSPDFFNIAQFPTIHFQSTKVYKGGSGLKIEGLLTLAGVTKPVTLDVDGPVPPQKGMRGGFVSGLSATTVIKRADFGFGPKFAPPMVGDEVKITIDAELGQK
ncbi:Polyisoprenoid-binding protein YceI [Bryocella elongata]|uniref:Polyisoprenoid-binding protein YceI n=1 Tax=Bryocella elongata TaxID=863522 RepID=A0A1H6BFF2_9BACT|nr:YceI family protein [Bryocella elongata]SEG59478.1 Polyisoprenoid-binding protein YceI [Bryocella elongata]